MLARDQVLEVLALLDQRDPARLAFGADAHGYALAPTLAEARVEAIEAAIGAALPADYRAFVTTIGAAGAGPGHGLVALDHPLQLEPLARPFAHVEALRPSTDVADRTSPYWSDDRLDGAILLCDHGCAYLSLLVVRGARAGEVWADLRAAGVGIAPSHPSFSAWYGEWLDAARREPPYPRCPAPGESCALPNALGSYFAQVEEQHGVGSGELVEAVVREALWSIPDGGIANSTGAGRFFAAGPIRLCACCSAMVDRFEARGMMRRAQLVPGQATLVERGGAT